MDLPRFQPRRALGNTGHVATRIGIGDIANRKVQTDQLIATLLRALDAGLNLIDTAPGYEDGYSEQIVGQALRHPTVNREKIFLIDKIDHHEKPVAPQVEGSLKQLGLDRIDAMVFHGVSSMERWTQLTADGGGFDELAEQVDAGRVRFRGISSHHPDVVIAAIESGLCDIVMFPIGPGADWRYVSDCLPLAKQRGIGTVCFKTFGAGKLLGDTPGYNAPMSDDLLAQLRQRPRGKVSSGGVSSDTEKLLPHLPVQDCVDFTFTVDPDVALWGMSYTNEQDEALQAAAGHTPLNDAQLADIHKRGIQALREKGKVWWNPTGEPARV